MSLPTSRNSAKAKPPEDLPLEPVSEESSPTELTPRRKTAGTSSVSADTVSSNLIGSRPRIVVPGLGTVTLVIH